MKRKTKVIIGVVIAALAVFLGYLAYLRFVTFGVNVPKKYESYIKYAYGDDVKISKPEREKSNDGKQGSTWWDLSYKAADGTQYRDMLGSSYTPGKSKESKAYDISGLALSAYFSRSTVVSGQLYSDVFKNHFPITDEELKKELEESSGLSYVGFDGKDYWFTLMAHDWELKDDIKELEKKSDVEGLEKYISDKNGIRVWNVTPEEFFKKKSCFITYSLMFHDEKTARENVGKIDELEKELKKKHPEIQSYMISVFYETKVKDEDGYEQTESEELRRDTVVLGKKVEFDEGNFGDLVKEAVGS